MPARREEELRLFRGHGRKAAVLAVVALYLWLPTIVDDEWAGIFLLVSAIGVWLIRNRALIPPPAELRATRGRAFRRLFDGRQGQ